MTTIHTACPLDCWDTCSWLVTLEEGKIVDLRGDPGDPYTRGFVCPKARYQLERSLADDRPLHPLRKIGGRWQRVEWDQALDLLAGKIRQAISEYGPASVFHYHDSGSMGLSKSLGKRLFRLLGGTSEPLGSLCWAAGIQAQEYDFGYHLANAPEDILESRMIVIWGRNSAATNVHLMPLLREARDKGTRVVVVDPLRSPTSKVADQHIQVKPATDAALALAMCNVIAAEKMADIPFIAAYTLGFHAFRDHIRQYTPAWAETFTGIPVESIVAFARAFASAKPASILMGYGFQRHFGGGNAVRACDALSALTGNVGRRGGGANYASGWIALRLRSLVPPVDPSQQPRRIPRAALSQVATLTDPPVRVMVVSGANPVNQAPGAGGVREALFKVPFKAVLDLRWTETCEVSDLFLPVASPFEDEDLYSCSWHPRLTFSERCVEPRGEALPDREIWRRLAGRLGHGSAFEKTMEGWVDAALEPVAAYGMNAAGIKGKTVDFPGFPRVAYQDGMFLTPSGKFEFTSARALRETGNEMATYVGPAEDGAPAGPAYPLRLLSPRQVNHLHSQFYERILSPQGLPVAYLSPGDLGSAGLEEGSRATLESAYGGMDVEVSGSGDVPNGVVLVYEGGSVLQGKGVNLLTPPGETDMGHGPRYYDCFVRIGARAPSR